MTTTLHLLLMNLAGMVFALVVLRFFFKQGISTPENTTALRLGLFLMIASVILTLFTFFNGLTGVKFDEHYIALGGYYISKGLIPHVDFFIPNGSFIYYLQSLGNFVFSAPELAYSFSASLVGVAGLLFIVQSIRKDLLTGLLDLSAVFLVYLFTFFAVAGCLWYNQLSAIMLTMCILIVHKIVKKKELPGVFDLILLHTFPFLCFLTKLDIFVCGFLIILSSLLFYTRFWRLCISISITTFLLVFCYLYGFYFFYKVNPFESMNHGQNGFDPRFAPNLYYCKKVVVYLFLSAENLAIRIIVFIHFMLLAILKKGRLYRLDYFSYIQLLVFIVAGSITVTSGRGAGFINSHFTLISFITLVYFIRTNDISIKRFGLWGTLLPSLLVFAFIYWNSFIPSFKLYKKQGAFYFVSPSTKEYFNAYDKLLKSFDRKVIVFSWVKYFLLNEKVSLDRSSKYLWEDLGTTVNRHDQQKVKDYFIVHKPDILIVNHTGGVSFFYRLFEDPALILSFVKENYDLYYQGKMDLIGSGGGVKSHEVSIYRIKSDSTKGK